MLNIRKRFFLLLTIVGLLFGIAACTNNDDYVRLSFDNDVYEVKVGQTIDVTPIVNKGSNVGAVTIEYTSYDDQIASYSNGKLQGLRVGETVIKVVCSEKPVAYDVATVRVVANSLPEVEFEPLQQNMLKGTTQTLKYHFVPEYGNALMSFTSANPEIATIDENGVITGVAKGTAVIIARATDELDSSQYRDYTFVVEVLEADFAITYELNGGTNDPTNPAGYNVLNLPIILKDATKLGHNFVGWYDNPEFSGSPIMEIAANSTGDMTLYAKWEVSVFDITYELNGGINASENPDSYDVNKLPLVLGEPTKTGYNFLGWYLDDEKIDSIVEGTTGEIKLVAQWEIATYNITFDLVGGSWQDLTGIEWPYNRDRNQMVADFIVDFNKHSGKTVAADGSDFFARSWMADGSSAGYKFLTSTEYGSKWGWLLDFINDNRLANGKTALNENDNQAEARGELHNFLNACAPGDKGGNASYGCDYSTEEGTTGFWLYMVDLEEVSVPKTYTVESEDIILPEIAYKMGYTFLGWFLNGEKVEKIVKGTTGDLNFVAEWEIVEYTIEYNLNGGLFDIYLYSSREEMVDDFLTDAMAYYNKDKKPNCMVDDSGTQVGFANVFTAIYGIFSSEEYGAKWAWLKEYIIYTATDAKASLESGSEAYWRYSLGAFLFEDHRASWPASADYTNDELANGFWSLLLKEGAVGPQYTYTVNDEVILLTPTKDGYKFLGWFDNAEGLGNPITEISKDAEEDITLYALWQDETINFDVTYVLNGGNTKWDSRDALIAEFLSDFSSIAGKTITAANFTTAAREAEFNALIKDDAMWAKWKWLFEFIASTDKHEKAPDFYNKVLNDRDGSDPDNKWFLTRDFAGFVNKTIGNFWFSVSPVDYSLFVNADGFWNLIETEYKDVDTNTLLTPYRPYYVFEGWYDNPELTGNPVKVIESDCTLYAKWSKQTVTLTYVIGDVDATIDQPEVLVHVSDSFDLVTPTYDDRYLKFNGWYLEPECINPVTKVNEYTNSDLMVYASWTEIDGYTINYVLNGGSLIYEDRDALLADFLKDYNEAMGKSYQTTADIPTGAFADIDYHTFFTKVLSDGTNIRGKWLWLAEYLLELSKRDLASNNCNVLGLTALINNNAYTGDATYGLSYAFRAFLIGTTIRPGSSYSSVDHSIYENAHGFWDKLSAAENTEYLNNKGTVTLPTAYLENYKFVGWYTNPEFTGEVVTTVEDTITVYAKFVEATPVESVSIDNKITELKRYETYQLEWSINPSNANIQAVKFESSDTSVATVDNKGLITAVSNGTVTIKMTSLSPSGKTDEFTFEVYSPDHFDINYETNSYVEIGKSILLLADYVKRDGSKVNLVWSSLTPEIASVDAGAVTGLKAGQAVIRVALADDANIYQDFVVTVLDSNLSDALKYVLSAHESNAFLSYDLGIGAGTPAYYRDIVGSVSKLLYNEPLTINDQYYATANANEKNHGGKMSSIEFITVHYTGNMAKGSTASANANYFATNTSTSIHYVTGNDGVFSVLDDSYVAYHAGDGTSVKFEWFPTGVTYKDGDPVYPVFGITANSKFSINGTETTISVPEGTTAATKKVTDSKWINDMGLAFKIVDGQYYMGTTWWCYSQVAEGRICSKGGNLNSIGIESAVNPESNLWYTWQRTAQLVAKLMLENDLDITRVKGHHFYSAKDCPQPLLENDLEIWWKFIEMVEHEYDMLTKYKDYQFTFELDTETTAVNNNGRVVEQPLYTEVVTYTVTIDNGTTSETITLSTIVEGMYCK